MLSYYYFHSISFLFLFFFFFFFNAPPTSEIYTLSLHDALPISDILGDAPLVVVENPNEPLGRLRDVVHRLERNPVGQTTKRFIRSEEHTSELQSRFDLVCRLLLEKKKKNVKISNLLMSLSIQHI